MVDLIRRVFCNHKHQDGSPAWKLIHEGRHKNDFGTYYFYIYICEKCMKRRKIKT